MGPTEAEISRLLVPSVGQVSQILDPSSPIMQLDSVFRWSFPAGLTPASFSSLPSVMQTFCHQCVVASVIFKNLKKVPLEPQKTSYIHYSPVNWYLWNRWNGPLKRQKKHKSCRKTNKKICCLFLIMFSCFPYIKQTSFFIFCKAHLKNACHEKNTAWDFANQPWNLFAAVPPLFCSAGQRGCAMC